MQHRLLALVLSLASLSCASARAASPAPAAAPTQRLAYRAVVDVVPASASRLVLRVRVPNECSAGALRELRATGLVGNAPFEVAIPASTPGAVHGANVDVSWSSDATGGTGSRAIEVATHGKALELCLCLGLESAGGGATGDVSALEQELAASTSLEIDGAPAAAPRTHLERVR